MRAARFMHQGNAQTKDLGNKLAVRNKEGKFVNERIEGLMSKM